MDTKTRGTLKISYCSFVTIGAIHSDIHATGKPKTINYNSHQMKKRNKHDSFIPMYIITVAILAEVRRIERNAS